MNKLKQDFETLKLINKYDITYSNNILRVHKKIKVNDLRLIRSLLIINHIKYVDIVVEGR